MTARDAIGQPYDVGDYIAYAVSAGRSAIGVNLGRVEKFNWKQPKPSYRLNKDGSLRSREQLLERYWHAGNLELCEQADALFYTVRVLPSTNVERKPRHGVSATVTLQKVENIIALPYDAADIKFEADQKKANAEWDAWEARVAAR